MTSTVQENKMCTKTLQVNNKLLNEGTLDLCYIAYTYEIQTVHQLTLWHFAMLQFTMFECNADPANQVKV